MITGQASESQSRAKQAVAVMRAMQEAVRQTLIDHKRSGDPVVLCDDDQIRWVAAEEIEIPEPFETP